METKDRQREEKTMIWLAGIVSADGFIKYYHYNRRFTISISSSERDWISQIKEKILRIGISCYVGNWEKKKPSTYINEEGKEIIRKPNYNIHFHDTLKLAKLFQKYHCEKYMMKRKWNEIKKRLYVKKHFAWSKAGTIWMGFCMQKLFNNPITKENGVPYDKCSRCGYEGKFHNRGGLEISCRICGKRYSRYVRNRRIPWNERPSCPKCNGSHTLSRGNQWNCKICNYWWKKPKWLSEMKQK